MRRPPARPVRTATTRPPKARATTVPGQVHCSRAFFEATRASFEFEARGEIEVKGMGRLPTYLLVGSRGGAPQGADQTDLAPQFPH